MEGRTMGMLLAPNMKKIAKIKEERANDPEPEIEDEIDEAYDDEDEDDEKGD